MAVSKPRRKPFDYNALKRKQLKDGVIDEDGTGRRARTMLCRRCGAPIFAGLDDDRTAFTARVDTNPLDVNGELVAVMTGRRTYRLSWRGRYELDPRTAIEISAQPAGDVEVLAEHRCGQPLPSARRGAQTARTAPRTASLAPDTPPY